MAYQFNGNKSHTLGVEIELQIVDSKTLALSNSVQQILDRVPQKWVDKIKTELMQNCCEINTDVCESIKQVEPDLSEKLKWTQLTANEIGLKLVWGGTHPFSSWQEQKYSTGNRYDWLSKAMRDISRRVVVFGLHVHVGVDSGDKAIQLCDRLLRHIPSLLALSANSPMFNSRDTGLASYRSNILDSLPTAGLPVQMRNWSEYVWLVDHLCTTGFIKSIREIWWDVRPHHEFGTVELRIMDMPMNMKHLLGLVALTQCLVAAISQQIDKGAYLYDCHPMIAKQNKWHASRYGMDAMFVDPDTMQAVPARQTVHRLMQRCIPFAEKLGCEQELKGLNDILDNGTGARLQREVFEKTQDMRQVVEFLIRQGPSNG
ncbi:MAG: YbdK family carboxylate-amine ligase [Planctomycetes bacterium]|nr:YbdK family carboxylate-amine ligase [Planctomycetota bacterium]